MERATPVISSEKLRRLVRADERFPSVPPLMPLVEYQVRYPVLGEDFARINQFYRTLADACVQYAETQLAEKSARDYEASPDRRKKYRWSGYVYSVDFTAVESGDTTVTISVDLRVCAGANVMFSRKLTHTWDFAHTLLIPPRKKETAGVKPQKKNVSRKSSEKRNEKGKKP